jgi:hypothetical protein
VFLQKNTAHLGTGPSGRRAAERALIAHHADLERVVLARRVRILIGAGFYAARVGAGRDALLIRDARGVPNAGRVGSGARANNGAMNAACTRITADLRRVTARASTTSAAGVRPARAATGGRRSARRRGRRRRCAAGARRRIPPSTRRGAASGRHRHDHESQSPDHQESKGKRSNARHVGQWPKTKQQRGRTEALPRVVTNAEESGMPRPRWYQGQPEPGPSQSTGHSWQMTQTSRSL